MLFLAGVSANATTGTATVVATGYSSPAFINVAPGQIVTFFVSGIGASLTGPVRANTAVLPTSLAGISAMDAQFTPTVSIPIVSVEPVPTCAYSTQPGCGSYTAVTVQMPFEMQTNCPGEVVGGLIPVVKVLFAENGTVVASMDANPVCDQIHLLRTCDMALPTPRTNTACNPVVTHADGSMVTSTAPAQAGEEIVIYAVGLGGGAGVAVAGRPPDNPVPVDVGLGFDFRPNAGPTRPAINISAGFVPAFSPAFSGMIPGFAGLYQINVIVPTPPPGLPSCSTYTAIGLEIYSNLTINVGGRASYDGVGICVQPRS
jgi:uncharacterized protein (TIGR03437 family)